jgi:hypothetical protein
MARTLGLTLATALPLVLVTTTFAQTRTYDVTEMETPGYGLLDYRYLPHGGFGFNYSQPVIAGDVVMDQYGFIHAAAAPVASTPVTAAQPQPRTRVSRSTAVRASARPRYQLPTGSLGWSDSGGAIILYSPAARYESYDSGYGRGPYGVTDYKYMYKGWPQ